ISKTCKFKTLLFTGRFKPVSKVLEVVHMDLVGPFPFCSSVGNKINILN
ncbi:hypothetical protein VP01_15627g1, partial [Puccinia sorghi]